MSADAPSVVYARVLTPDRDIHDVKVQGADVDGQTCTLLHAVSNFLEQARGPYHQLLAVRYPSSDAWSTRDRGAHSDVPIYINQGRFASIPS